MIFRLLNLNGTRVQSNFDGRNSGFEFTATVENLHSKGLRSCSQALLIIQKYFRAGPAKKLFILVHRQYKSFYSDDTLKSECQLGWVIKLVFYNLVWRIRFWTIKTFEKEFRYLYWTISKIIYWNLFLDREKLKNKGFSFRSLEFESKHAGNSNDDEAWVRATVHPVVFEASYAASTMCCAQVQIQVDYAAELDDVG